MPESNYSLKINGETRRIRTESTMPLLWALRDVVGLTGTKYGCGIIQCSACHVMVNGTVTKSCNVTVGSAARKNITTIEGLDTPIGRAVKQAWIDEQVPQCGYCQSGAIMSAVALLERRPQPTDAEIDQAMANICACGTYARMRAAIKRAAGMS
ncbi:MAG: (2Fe-2S)-binding protein [Ilumatobacteraceae bacterium]